MGRVRINDGTWRAGTGGAELTVVLFVSSPGLGVTYHLANLAVALRRLGVPVIAVSSPGEQLAGISGGVTDAGIRLERLEGLDSGGVLAALGAARRLARLAGGCVMHTQTLRQLVVAKAARLVSGERAGGIVYTANSLGRPGPARRRLRCALMNVLADFVAAPSRQVLELMAGLGLSRERSGVVHNWVDAAAFDTEGTFEALPDVDGFKIACLASFHRAKGHRYLLEAAAELIRRGRRIHLMFAGSGPHEAETKRLAGKLGIGGRVHFLGYVDNRSVPALLSHCDMSVLPSLRETFGVSGVEPLLLGKPVVASRVGVLPELERTGGVLCVPPGDAGAIGRAVEGVMDNYPEAARRARAGRAWVVEQCDLPRAARAYAQVYERLAAGGRP